MLKENLQFKEQEENPLAKLIESENFNKEELKEKMLEAFIRKSEFSYNMFEKLLVKYGSILKDQFPSPSDLIS